MPILFPVDTGQPPAVHSIEDDPARRGPGWFDHHWTGRYRQAATKALALYPGAVGRLLEREILAAVDFKYLPSEKAVIAGVVAAIEATPFPLKAA